MRALPAGVAGVLLVLVAACSAPAAPPGGLTEEQASFVAEVGPWDEHLADPTVVARLGEDICADLDTGTAPAEVALRSQRFTGGEVALDRQEAERVVESARRHLCS